MTSTEKNQKHEQLNAQTNGKSGAPGNGNPDVNPNGQPSSPGNGNPDVNPNWQPSSPGNDNPDANPNGQPSFPGNDNPDANPNGQVDNQVKRNESDQEKDSITANNVYSNIIYCLDKLSQNRPLDDFYTLSGIVILFLCIGIVICIYSFLTASSKDNPVFAVLLIFVLCIITILIIFKYIYNVYLLQSQNQKRITSVILELSNKVYNREEIEKLKKELDRTKSSIRKNKPK